jgi:hypothetical protein
MADSSFMMEFVMDPLDVIAEMGAAEGLRVL